MLTGDTPYVGDNFAQIFDQHLKSDPPHVTQCGVECPAALDDLIIQSLAKNPEDRPFNARWVQGFLGEVLELGTEASDQADQAAVQVKAQQLLSQRVLQKDLVDHDVTCGKLGWVVAAVLAAIVVALFVNR